MKKTLLALVAIILLMNSCSQSTDYVISGTAEGYADGTKVYLQMREKPNWITIDSTTIEKGRFTLRGQVEPGFLGYINIGDDRALVVVEPGNITIDFKDGYGYPHGTDCNERLTTYSHTMDSLDFLLADVMASIDSLELADTATYLTLRARVEELDQEEYQLLAQVIRNNITNPLGIGMYCMYNSAFADDIDFLFKLSQQIPEEYLQQQYVAKVLENVSIISCTSVGNHFTDLMMTTREGNDISLESLVKNNKYVLVDFWASWCGPCRQSLPGIRQLYVQYGDKGLCIVGISLDEDKAAWEAAIEKYDMEWIQVSELNGWHSEHAAAYGVRAIPATVLIDNSGMIIGRNLEAGEIAKIIDNQGAEE